MDGRTSPAKTPHRRLLALFVGVAIHALASGAAAQQAPLKIGLNVWPGSAALTFAHEKLRLFAKHGLVEGKDFEFVHHDNYPTMVEAFISGGINVTQISIYDALEAVAGGKEFSAFGVPVDNRGYDLLVARRQLKDTIRSVADLKGRRVAFAKGSIGEFLVRRFLENAGLGMEDIKPVHVSHLGAWCAVKQGIADAGIVIFPVREPDYPVLATTRSFPLPNLWVVDAQTLKARPDLPAKLLALWEDVYDYIEHYPNQFKDYMAQRFQFALKVRCAKRAPGPPVSNEILVAELRQAVPLLSSKSTATSYWKPGAKHDIWHKAKAIADFMLSHGRSEDQAKKLEEFKSKPDEWLKTKWLVEKEYLPAGLGPRRRAPAAAVIPVVAQPRTKRPAEQRTGPGFWLDHWDGRRGGVALAICVLAPLPIVALLLWLLRRRTGWIWPLLAAILLPVWAGGSAGLAWIYARHLSTLRLVTIVFEDVPQTTAVLQPVCELLERQLGRPVQLRVIGLSEAERTVVEGAYDFYSLTAGAYVKLTTAEQLKLLGQFAFISGGKPSFTYKSSIAARPDSGIRTFADLRGKVVAYVDHNSSSGYIIPHHFFTHLRQYLEKHPQVHQRHFPGEAIQSLPDNFEAEFAGRVLAFAHKTSWKLLRAPKRSVDAIATVSNWAKDEAKKGKAQLVGEIPIEIPAQLLAVRPDLPRTLASEAAEGLREMLSRLPPVKGGMVGFRPAAEYLATAGSDRPAEDQPLQQLRQMAGKPGSGLLGMVVFEGESRIPTLRGKVGSKGIAFVGDKRSLEQSRFNVKIDIAHQLEKKGGSVTARVTGKRALDCAKPLLAIFDTVTRRSCRPGACGWDCSNKEPGEIRCKVSRTTDEGLAGAVEWFVGFWQLNLDTPEAFVTKDENEFMAGVGGFGQEGQRVALLDPPPKGCVSATLQVVHNPLAEDKKEQKPQLVVHENSQPPKPRRFKREDIEKVSVIRPGPHLAITRTPPEPAMAWGSVALCAGVLVVLLAGGLTARRWSRWRRRRPEPGFEPIRNVYIVGNPVKTKDMFFGREDEFHQIHQWVTHGGPKVILLKGGRRSGKTSILFQIANGRLGEAAGAPVFLDFHSLAPRFRQDSDVALRIGDVIHEAEPFRSIELPADGSSATERLLLLVDRCLEQIAPRPLLLLGDEVEALEALLGDGSLSTRAFQWLPPLFNRQVFLAVTGSRQFGSLLGPMINSITQIKDISLFSFEDAAALVQKPVEGKLRYEPNAVSAIYRLSGGQPFFIQYICQTLVHQINLKHKRRTVVVADLAGVIDFVVRNPHGHLHETWRALSLPQRAALAALANGIRNDRQFVGDTAILRLATERRFPADPGAIHEGLAGVVQATHILERSANRFRFRCDLLRHWIRHTYQTGEDLHEQ